MEPKLGEKINNMRLLLMLFVVAIHVTPWTVIGAESLANSGDPASFSEAITLVLRQDLAGVSVPMFFAISGFLFVRNTQSGFGKEYAAKMHRRLYTLGVPSGVTATLVLSCKDFGQESFTPGALSSFHDDAFFPRMLLEKR